MACHTHQIEIARVDGEGAGFNPPCADPAGGPAASGSNLKKGAPYRFKPGQSGNPGGRPRRRPISERYAELAELRLPEKDRIKHGLPKGATYGDALAAFVFKAALEGNPYAAREIREAIEGKTGQRQEETPGEDITVTIVNVGSLPSAVDGANRRSPRSHQEVISQMAELPDSRRKPTE
jgi:hypothetical protein